MKDKKAEDNTSKLLLVKKNGKKKPFTCHFYKKPGHYKRDYRKCLPNCRQTVGVKNLSSQHPGKRGQHSFQDAMVKVKE